MARFTVMEPLVFEGFGSGQLGIRSSIADYTVNYRETILKPRMGKNGKESCVNIEEFKARY